MIAPLPYHIGTQEEFGDLQTYVGIDPCLCVSDGKEGSRFVYPRDIFVFFLEDDSALEALRAYLARQSSDAGS